MKTQLIRILLLVIVTASVSGWISVASANTQDRDHRLGAGLMIGSMTSVTGKYKTSSQSALDFGVALFSAPWTAVYGDYLWQYPGFFGSSSPLARQTTAYLGAGGGLGFWTLSKGCIRYYCGTDYSSSGTSIFFRGLVGVEWNPLKPNLGIFLEIGPTLGLGSGFVSVLDLGLGGRFYF